MSKSFYKETKRKIVIPFTLEQFKDTIERIKVEYNAGNLHLVGLFEIETLEHYYEKAKENKQVQKQEKLLELYKELNIKRRELIAMSRNNTWSWKLDIEIKEIEKQIKEIENE